jgi:hypothetical protein
MLEAMLAIPWRSCDRGPRALDHVHRTDRGVFRRQARHALRSSRTPSPKTPVMIGAAAASFTMARARRCPGSARSEPVMEVLQRLGSLDTAGRFRPPSCREGRARCDDFALLAASPHCSRFVTWSMDLMRRCHRFDARLRPPPEGRCARGIARRRPGDADPVPQRTVGWRAPGPRVDEPVGRGCRDGALPARYRRLCWPMITAQASSSATRSGGKIGSI